MSNQQTENPETKLVIPIKYPILIGCVILPIILIALCLMPILINTVTVLYNQIRWNSAHIDNYSIEIGYFGMAGGQPLQTIVVKDGELVRSTISFTRDGKALTDEGSGFLNLTVNDLFSRAYRCFIYTFCHVEFDDEYGFPSQLGGGFIESGWISARNLELSKN